MLPYVRCTVPIASRRRGCSVHGYSIKYISSEVRFVNTDSSIYQFCSIAIRLEAIASWVEAIGLRRRDCSWLCGGFRLDD